MCRDVLALLCTVANRVPKAMGPGAIVKNRRLGKLWHGKLLPNLRNLPNAMLSGL
jgi:hypothetical protein